MKPVLCRVCRETLAVVLDLGDLAYTGTFPEVGESVPSGRLRLSVCSGCGLAQLADDFDASAMYGDNYGYRSGLNASMVAHLTRTTAALARRYGTMHGDVVVDIGANDGTLLRSWGGGERWAIDPTLPKWAEHYDPADGITQVPDFFTADAYRAAGGPDANVVTSVAMFYDLPDPVAFARDVHSILMDDGLWHVEVAYAPWMLRSGAYDGICHEHTEYYSLTTLLRVAEAAGFYPVDVTTNGTNGGSLAVTLAKDGSGWPREYDITAYLLATESRNRVHDPLTWTAFADTVRQRQSDLVGLLSALRVSGRIVSGLGASTKGNVLLQSSGIGTALIDRIGDVNPYKYGRTTPGTDIPIVPESVVLDAQPDYLLVLPWHFRESLMAPLAGYIAAGGRLILPLPDIEIVG